MMRTGPKLRNDLASKPASKSTTNAVTAEIETLQAELQRQKDQLAKERIELAEKRQRLQTETTAATSWIAAEQEALSTLRCRLESERTQLAAERATWQSFQRTAQATPPVTVDASPSRPTSHLQQQRLDNEQAELARKRQALEAKRRAIRLEQKDLKIKRQEQVRAHRQEIAEIDRTRARAEQLRTEASLRIMEAEKVTRQLDAKRRVLELEEEVRRRELRALDQAIADRRRTLGMWPSPGSSAMAGSTGAGPAVSTDDTFGGKLADRCGIGGSQGEGSLAEREEDCIVNERELAVERQMLDDLARTLERRTLELEAMARTVMDAETRQNAEREQYHQLLKDLHRQQPRTNEIQAMTITPHRALGSTWPPVETRQRILADHELNLQRLDLERQEDRYRWQQRIAAITLGARERTLERGRQQLRESRRELGLRESDLVKRERHVERSLAELQHERCALLEQRLLLESATATWLERLQAGSAYRRKLHRLRRRLQQERSKLLSRDAKRSQELDRSLAEVAKLRASLEQLSDARLAARPPVGRNEVPTAADSGFWLAQRYRQMELRWTQERRAYQQTIERLATELDNVTGDLVLIGADDIYRDEQQAA